MLTLAPTVRVFLCAKPADMRKGFDGLAAMTAGVIREDPLSGHLFVFRNRRGDRLKVLYWQGDGYCLWYKRLEAGTFELPHALGPSVEITAAELGMILEGIALPTVRRRKRFVLARPVAATG